MFSENNMFSQNMFRTQLHTNITYVSSFKLIFCCLNRKAHITYNDCDPESQNLFPENTKNRHLPPKKLKHSQKFPSHTVVKDVRAKIFHYTDFFHTFATAR